MAKTFAWDSYWEGEENRLEDEGSIVDQTLKRRERNSTVCQSQKEEEEEGSKLLKSFLNRRSSWMKETRSFLTWASSRWSNKSYFKTYTGAKDFSGHFWHWQNNVICCNFWILWGWQRIDRQGQNWDFQKRVRNFRSTWTVSAPALIASYPFFSPVIEYRTDFRLWQDCVM